MIMDRVVPTLTFCNSINFLRSVFYGVHYTKVIIFYKSFPFRCLYFSSRYQQFQYPTSSTLNHH